MPNSAPVTDALGNLVVEVFRLNGLLLAAGDELTRDLGLSSARWQVLGAIELAGQPLAVSKIARDMGLTRQSVQRVVNELSTDEFVTFADNPDHRRSKLVVPTAKGRKAFAEVMRRQRAWSARILRAAAIDERELRKAETSLKKIRLSLMERNDEIQRNGSARIDRGSTATRRRRPGGSH